MAEYNNKVQLQNGIVLIDLTQDTVTEETLGKGVTAHDRTGKPIVGTYEPPKPVLQSKTVSPSTSSQAVKPDTGYDGLSQVTVNAMTTATQATPSISVSSAGLITASATQSAGYVSAGTKSATKQLTVQAAKTVTPTTSNQTAVASGRYTTGAITVKGDANLKAENIKSGVSIFGVAGSHSGAEDLTAELTEYSALNAELESVIDSLPSAGGGSAVETCTVTLNRGASEPFIQYTNPSMEVAVGTFSDFTLTVEVVKGTLLCIGNTGYSANCSGEIVLYATLSDDYGNPYAVVAVNGDGAIELG